MRTITINWANRLTILRLLLAPLFAILVIYDYNKLALLTFCLAAISDALDGFIARAFNQRTMLGTFLDPLADKLLLNTSFIALSALKHLPVWLTVLVLSRDIIIVTGISVLYILNGHVEISPTLLGKATTMIQIITILMVLVCSGLEKCLTHNVVFWLAGVLTVISGLHYIYLGTSTINNREESESCSS